MSKREAIARYNLIINKLRKAPATFQEVSDYLSRESELQDYNFNVSKRTFQRDIDDILSLYHIDIQFDFNRGVYHIEADSQPDINNRMLEAFDTFHALNIAGGLSQYIHFESRKPQGTEHFYGLLHAIKNRLVTRFSYHKFWEEEPAVRTAEPYALKEFKSRWYLVAKDSKDDKIKTFGLDRVSDLEITRKKFSPPQMFNAEDLFKNCFGIITSQQKPERIILSFAPVQGKYIKSFPLHSSQSVITDDEDELRISLDLCITHDLLMELLSYGTELTVISPGKLKKELCSVYKSALSNYK